MDPPGHTPLVVNVVVMGPFEEEEEGIGITSEVVKVKSAENLKTVTIPQYRVNETKQPTR